MATHRAPAAVAPRAPRNGDRCSRTAVDGGCCSRRAVRRRLSGVPDEGAVLRALRVRVQSAARLRRPAVVRPRDVPRHGRLRLPRTRRRSGASRPSSRSSPARRRRRCSALVVGALAIRRQGIYFAMITLALAQMIYFFCLQAPFTGGEDGIQAVPRGTLFGVHRPAEHAGDVLRRARRSSSPASCSSTASSTRRSARC